MDKEKLEENNITPEEISNSISLEENSGGPKTISAEEVKKPLTGMPESYILPSWKRSIWNTMIFLRISIIQ